MSRSKSKEAVIEVTQWPAIVVGAGPAGLTLVHELHKSNPQLEILLLESTEKKGGKIASGLHLVNAEAAAHFEQLKGPSLKPALIRWERNWVSAEHVNWKDKEWIAPQTGPAEGPGLPQWAYYLKGAKAFFKEELPMTPQGPLKEQASVNRLSFKEGLWELEVVGTLYQTPNLIWAAGIQAFQNAFGKFEAQTYMAKNPLFEAAAQDFRGGLSLELKLAERPQAEGTFDFESVFALPVKHGGKRYLLIGAFESLEDGKLLLQTLTHVSPEVLNDPKEILSFEKSLRRGLKMIFPELKEESQRLIVSPRVGGHSFGTPWLLKTAPGEGLYFIGDESESINAEFIESLGALHSAQALKELILNGVLQKTVPEPSAELPQNPTTSPSEA